MFTAVPTKHLILLHMEAICNHNYQTTDKMYKAFLVFVISIDAGGFDGISKSEFPIRYCVLSHTRCTSARLNIVTTQLLAHILSSGYYLLLYFLFNLNTYKSSLNNAVKPISIDQKKNKKY